MVEAIGDVVIVKHIAAPIVDESEPEERPSPEAKK
jgi:hypothetical protein